MSIRSPSPIYRSSNTDCTDCVCNCFNSPSSLISSCSGVNCFPSNQSCQLLTQQPWILESDTLINFTASNLFIMKVNSSRLCACYTPERILAQYSQTVLASTSSATNFRSVKYISNDNTFILLNSTLIEKVSAGNISAVERNLFTSDNAVSILHNDSTIYIAFNGNRTINMFDLNLGLLQTSVSWINQTSSFSGMFFWNNQILIMDTVRKIIWTVTSLNQVNLTKFFDFSAYNIPNPISLFIYHNQSLFIASLSQNVYLFYLNNLTLQQTITVPVNVMLLYMRYDSNCDRLWFGTSNYAYAPVIDLASNQLTTYPTSGMISKAGVISIDFDSQYMAVFTDTNGYLRQTPSPSINCG